MAAQWPYITVMVDTSVRIPDDLYATVKAAAEQDLRSVNSEILYLLGLGLERRSER